MAVKLHITNKYKKDSGGIVKDKSWNGAPIMYFDSVDSAVAYTNRFSCTPDYTIKCAESDEILDQWPRVR